MGESRYLEKIMATAQPLLKHSDMMTGLLSCLLNLALSRFLRTYLKREREDLK